MINAQDFHLQDLHAGLASRGIASVRFSFTLGSASVPNPQEWTELLKQFGERLSALETHSIDGAQAWRLCVLAKALDFLEEQQLERAADFLSDFDRPVALTEVPGAVALYGKSLDVGDLRPRFEAICKRVF